MRKLIIARALFGLVLVLAMSGVGAAGQIYPSIPPCPLASEVIYQYAVKVVQGTTQGLSVSPNDPLGAGLYRTSVNVHNPSANLVDYRIKLAVAGHNGLPGTITVPFVVHQLASDEVTQYDGEDFDSMLAQMGPVPNFYEGYFVIESKAELDIVGVYTGSVQEIGYPLATMETERVPARQISVPCCVGLGSTPINTGPSTQWYTPWQSPWLISAAPVGSTLALLLGQEAPVSTGCLPPPSSANVTWVGTDCPGGSTDLGEYIYSLYFCLCCDFAEIKMNINFSADDWVTAVVLNGVTVFSGSLPSGTVNLYGLAPSLIPTSSQPFVCGMNTLDIHVWNNALGPSALMVEGGIKAKTGGYCP